MHQNQKSSFQGAASDQRQRQGSGQYQGKPLAYYPEELHLPDEKACQTFNARIMKHIMKQKMGKNETFYSSKVANAVGASGEHSPNQNFIKARQNQHNQAASNNLNSQRVRATAAEHSNVRQESNHAHMLLTRSNEDKKLASSASNVLARRSNQLSNQLDASNLVNNHESTRMVD